MNQRRRPGVAEEDQAAEYLLSLGYTLLGRRVKMTRGELDLVALDENVVVIVEVKARRTELPEAAITRGKSERIRAAAAEYVARHGLEGRELRFDLVTFSEEGLRHHPGGLALDEEASGGARTKYDELG